MLYLSYPYITITSYSCLYIPKLFFLLFLIISISIEQVEDDDEVLLVMASELGQMMDYIGGPKDAVILLNPLSSLAGVEETVVRDKAVESCCTVINGLEVNDIVEHVVPILQRLSTGDWFTSRVSACGLFSSTYGKLTAQQTESKKILRQ